MRHDANFDARVKRIHKAEKRRVRARTAPARRMGERLLTPILFVICATGGTTVAWDAMDRPTDTPFAFAESLTRQAIGYLGFL